MIGDDDVVTLRDGTVLRYHDFIPGDVRVAQIARVRAARAPVDVSRLMPQHFQQRPAQPLSASQRECLDGQP